MTDATTKPKPVDLSAFDTTAACDKGAEMELHNPITNEPLGAFITLVGKDSTQFREFNRTNANANLRRSFQRQRKGKDAEAPTVEQIEADAINLLVACTTGWRNIEYAGGPFAFNEENCRRLYTEQLWVRAQVDEFVGDLENFMPA